MVVHKVVVLSCFRNEITLFHSVACSHTVGAHTNHIEGCWRYAKAYIKPLKPVDGNQLAYLLNVYMWRQWYAKGWPGGILCRFLHDLRALHYN